jgi:hypothetical protein
LYSAAVIFKNEYDCGKRHQLLPDFEEHGRKHPKRLEESEGKRGGRIEGGKEK